MADELVLDPVPEIAKPAMAITDKIMEKIIDDPFGSLANMDTVFDFAYKLMPTMPDEAPFPMPRGIFDKLKDLPTWKNKNK